MLPQWKMETSSLKCGCPVWPMCLWSWWIWELRLLLSSLLRICSLHSQREICCKSCSVHWISSNLKIGAERCLFDAVLISRSWLSVCLCREDIYIKSESPSSNGEQSTFPEHNCNSILKVRRNSPPMSGRNSVLCYVCMLCAVCLWESLVRHSTISPCGSFITWLFLSRSHLQYLSYCMDLCPRAYSDSELLLLLTVVGRVGLDTRLMLQSSVELYPLQYKIVNNIRDWSNMVSSCMSLVVVVFFKVSED